MGVAVEFDLSVAVDCIAVVGVAAVCTLLVTVGVAAALDVCVAVGCMFVVGVVTITVTVGVAVGVKHSVIITMLRSHDLTKNAQVVTDDIMIFTLNTSQ